MLMENGSASWDTVASPCMSRARMARRVGSAILRWQEPIRYGDAEVSVGIPDHRPSVPQPVMRLMSEQR
jgi:hypothetical protein